MSSCLLKEFRYLMALSGVRIINSIYFGGGTPSLAKPSTIQSLIECVIKTADLQTDAEITLECNPTSLESNLLSDFKSAGINRVSIGVQALKDDDLKQLGRNHSVSEALNCLEAAKILFPGSTSIDVIFGRPGQSRKSWISELLRIVKLCDDHLSLYQLTLERGTALFKQIQNRDLVMPDDDCITDMYEDNIEILTEEGFSHYEVSNYARNGAESKHNHLYWNGSQYIGIGPGAHGRFASRGIGKTEREARIQTLEPDNWMWEVEKYGHGTRKVTTLSTTDVLEELLMTGLRRKRGILNERWCKHSNGITLCNVFGMSKELKYYTDENFLLFNGTMLTPTEKGMKIADSITKDLLSYIKLICEKS